jgi:flagellar hook-basal body complex protein FliE
MRHTAPVRPMPWISEEALACCACHGWPGNVRELENVVRRALLLAEGFGAAASDEIRPEHIQFDTTARLVAAEQPAAAPAIPLPESPIIGASLPAPADMAGLDTGPARRLANIVQIGEAKAILETLAACGGSRIAAARELGISERTLRYRLASLREAGCPWPLWVEAVDERHFRHRRRPLQRGGPARDHATAPADHRQIAGAATGPCHAGHRANRRQRRATGTNAAGGFADTLHSALGAVNASQQRADTPSAAYETGQTQDVAKVMLARQEASVGFEPRCRCATNCCPPIRTS